MKEVYAIFTIAICAVAALVVGLINLLCAILNYRLARKILRKEEAMTDQEQKLVDAVKAAADEEASLETRVDGLIAALKQPADSPIVAQAIADLEAMKTREAGFSAPALPPPGPEVGAS